MWGESAAAPSSAIATICMCSGPASATRRPRPWTVAPLTMLPLTVRPSCEVRGARSAPNGELPSYHYPDRRRQTPQLQREAHLAVHRPSACSGVKALRNTSVAKAASRQAALAFRSLDPFRALREPDPRRRDEETFPLRTKSSRHQKRLLDRKSPHTSHSQQSLLRLQGRLGQRLPVPRRTWGCCGSIVPRRNATCGSTARAC